MNWPLKTFLDIYRMTVFMKVESDIINIVSSLIGRDVIPIDNVFWNLKTEISLISNITISLMSQWPIIFKGCSQSGSCYTGTCFLLVWALSSTDNQGTRRLQNNIKDFAKGVKCPLCNKNSTSMLRICASKVPTPVNRDNFMCTICRFFV